LFKMIYFNSKQIYAFTAHAVRGLYDNVFSRKAGYA